MKTIRCFTVLAFTMGLSHSLLADQSLAGNLTITGGLASGDLNVTGKVDVDGDRITLGTTATPDFGGYFRFQDSATDTVTSYINRTSASWLWQHLSNVAAMRLDSGHQLLLYQADGTAGVTLSPATTSLKLGSTATLTGNGTGDITASGLFKAVGLTLVSGNITSQSSSSSLTLATINGTTGNGLTLKSSSSGTTNITLNASSDIIFQASGSEKMRLKNDGKFGIGTSGPLSKLHVSGDGRFTLASGQSLALEGTGSNTANAGPNLLFTDTSGAGIASALQQGAGGGFGLWTYNGSWGERLHVTQAGNVGIGTTSPATRLQVAGGTVRSDLGATGTSFIGTGTGSNLQVSHDGSAYVALFNSGGGIQFRDINGTSNIVTMASGGNVGIGTITPAAPLNVVSSALVNSEFSNGTVKLDVALGTSGPNTGSFLGTATNHPMFFYANNSAPALALTPAGNVGIGTANPAEKLEVAGGAVLVSGVVNPYLMLKSSAAGAPYGFLQYDQSEGNYMRIFDGTEYSMIWKAGKVGIGTTTPAAKLQVSDLYSVSSDQELLSLQAGYATNSARKALTWRDGTSITGQIDTRYDGTSVDMVFGHLYNAGYQTGDVLTIKGTGNVGIGTSSPTHKLAVKGTIRAQEIIVDTGWADYVFEDSYRLAPLSEVEQHIKEKKHLPGIPSAKEVEEHGVSMGDMQAKLLAKVEELTLHLIAQEKNVSALRAQNAALLERVRSLEASR